MLYQYENKVFNLFIRDFILIILTLFSKNLDFTLVILLIFFLCDPKVLLYKW